MGDHGDLLAPGLLDGIFDRRLHPGPDVFEALPPRRPPRISEMPPMPRRAQEGHGGPSHPLDGGSALDDALVRNDLDPRMARTDRLRGLLCPLQGAGPEHTEIRVGQSIGCGLSLLPTALGEVIARHPAVDDPLWVLDLTMSNEMHRHAHVSRLVGRVPACQPSTCSEPPATRND